MCYGLATGCYHSNGYLIQDKKRIINYLHRHTAELNQAAYSYGMEQMMPLSEQEVEQREEAFAFLWEEWWQSQLPWQKELWLKRHRQMREVLRAGGSVVDLWD